jgi:hypothetical protein
MLKSTVFWHATLVVAKIVSDVSKEYSFVFGVKQSKTSALYLEEKNWKEESFPTQFC